MVDTRVSPGFDTARLPLASLAFSYFVMGTSTVAVVGSLPFIAEGIHASLDSAAQLLAVFALTFAVAAPAIQVWFSHVPRRTLILGGLTLATVGSALSAAAPGYDVLFFARVLTALGSAAIGPVASALGAGMVAREHQGRALATVFVGMTMASVLSAPLASWFAGLAGWRAMFAAIAGLNAVAALAVAILVHDHSAGQRMSFAALFDVLRQPRFGAAIGVALFGMAGVFVSYALAVPLLRDHFGLAAGLVPAALMTFGVAGVLGNVVARYLSYRWSADRAVAVALIGMACVFTILYFAPRITAAPFAVMGLWAIANDLLMPAQQRRLVELAPDLRGLVLALNASALYVGMSAGAFVGGRLAGRAGLAALPVGSMLFIGAAMIALQVSRFSARRGGAPMPIHDR